MPLSFNQLMPSGAHIWIWHLTETKEALEKFVRKEDFNEILIRYKHPQRQLQKMAISILTQQLGDGHVIDIQYDELGKPAPKDFPGFISISHTTKYAGLLYHPLHPCGLDLEEISQRLLKVAPRFINEIEKKWLDAKNPLNDIGLIWSVKEALFKNIGGGGIFFKEQLEVNKPSFIDDVSGWGWATYKKDNLLRTFEYRFINLEDVLLVHTIAIESERNI